MLTDLLTDRYRILSPLGAGGMGEVFLAEDKRSGHYSPKGEAIEIAAVIAATRKELEPVRKRIERINAVIR